MLELDTLMIHAWTRSAQPDGAAAWIRRIADAAGRPLGFARFDSLFADSWFFWRRKTRIDVFETEDAAHLLSLTRSWAFRSVWDLHDAEDRLVGYVYPKSLVATEVGLLGFVDAEASDGGRVLDHAGLVLATFGKQGNQVQVTFTPDRDPNPFLRMLILGCVLARDPKPKSG
jgi:hypothetical protein